MTDVLVIGAGPAGLAAAVSARRGGASVVLLESSDSVGGQYWRHLPPSRPSRSEALLHHGWARFQHLRDSLERDAGCRIITSAQVWAIEPGTRGEHSRSVHVLVGEPDGSDREPLTLTPDALVLATGAHDRTLPFPGWDLPGVFTAGAAQAMAKGERVAVGERVVVAGAGPFLLPVAASLAQTGSRVLGVYEANRIPALLRGWLPRPWALLGASAKGAELAGYVLGQLRNRIPYRTGRGVIAAHGNGRVETVTIAALDEDWAPIAGTDEVIQADAVCVGHGFSPRLELAIAAGCALTENRFVRVSGDQLTSVPGVYAAGEITGIGGVDLALAEGAIAGAAAAGADPAASRSARARRRTFAGFAARIEAAHGIRGGWPGWLTADTTICRCEEVGYGRLCGVAQATGSSSLRSLKLTTRAGLGICQGRICGRTVEELLARQAGPLTDGAIVDRRPIATPIRISELARIQQQTGAQTTTTPTEGQ